MRCVTNSILLSGLVMATTFFTATPFADASEPKEIKLARVHFKSKKYARALGTLNRYIESKPESKGDLADAYFYRGKTYKALAKDKLAIIDFDECIKLNPKNVKMRYDRAELLIDLKQH